MEDRKDLRKLWRKYFEESDLLFDEYYRKLNNYNEIIIEKNLLKIKINPNKPVLNVPPFPEELRNLSCGAKTRKGTPCKRKDLYISGRCKLHGGLSTGPKTIEGKMRSALNGKIPKKKRSP